jgi:AraC-like DNA-binding protein
MINRHLNFIVPLLSYVTKKNVSVEELFRMSGIHPEVLHSPLQTSPLQISPLQLNRLWTNALQLTQDPLLGLHLGEALPLSALGLTGSILSNSLTIIEAFQQCSTFLSLVTDLFDLSISIPTIERPLTIKFIPCRQRAYPQSQRQTLELFMVFILRHMDGLLLTTIKPSRVVMPHEDQHKEEYQRAFGCSHLLNHQEYAIELNGLSGKEPLPSADYELQSLLLRYTQKDKSLPNRPNSLSIRISNLLKSQIQKGIPSLKEMAASLHTSTRSLQRHLQKEGLSYQSLAASVRKTIALHYLGTGTHYTGEISCILGFRKPSAFSRAFKEWTGISPQEYRKRHQRPGVVPPEADPPCPGVVPREADPPGPGMGESKLMD